MFATLANYLDGKKLYIVGVALAVWGVCRALFPNRLPDVDETTMSMIVGGLVIVFRAFSSKPGVLAPKAGA